MLKLRDKLSRKRNVMLEDEEKPFLEHLEDLRKMLMRMAITLVVAVTGCFIFNSWFFEVVQYPMQRAGLNMAMEKNVPENIDMASWTQIHNAARGASILQGDQRRLFLDRALSDQALRPYVEGFLLFHTASMLHESQRDGFVAEAVKAMPADRSPGVAEAVAAIRKASPSSSLEELKPVIENVAMAPAETFMLSMKLSTFAGIVVSFPLLFYFLLEFILPGLNTRERRLMWPALAIGFGLFLGGVVFSYYFVVPNALEFFHAYSAELNVKDTWRIGDYTSFVTTFCLIFGVSFELPVVVMIMVKLDLLTSQTMRRTRAWAVVIIVTAGAILTPTGDIYTLLLLSGPMVLMYETCIWLAVARERKNSREEAEEQARDMARRASLVGVASVQAARPGAVTPEDIYSQSALGYQEPDPHHDHGAGHADQDDHHGGSWADHPYHSEPGKPTAEEEHAQYMREHAHLFSNADTHAESVPVEERNPGHTTSPELDPNPETTPPAAPAPATSADEGGVPNAPSGWAPAPEAGWESAPEPDSTTADSAPEASKPDAGDGGGDAAEKPKIKEDNPPSGSNPDKDSHPA
ncbi:MAG: hypothetical protein JWM59_2258 [Verrucomicrobiales bacterium]|nr:hypothetical protein [Verrucomicrobiales bacterium]